MECSNVLESVNQNNHINNDNNELTWASLILDDKLTGGAQMLQPQHISGSFEIIALVSAWCC